MRSRVEELFHEVADLPVDARARHFVERNVDTLTRKEVEALLAFDLASTQSLDRNIGELAEGALARLEPTDIQCGPYRLGLLLGRGGMGTVHLGERVDGELSQRVAVKLLQPGLNNFELRQRFLAERQILATLSHPNIARLLDAGHRDDGQPYLVMEYVEGKPIDVYGAGLSIKAKITLFLKVCAAVGCLHRNLVVHRDLKPPNILVTQDGEPKLLDFGIAKMLDLTTDTTVTALRMLTPDYASPEQVAGGPVTTATDIYSLGAVLYKLLTGVSPHKFDKESPGAIALAISNGNITQPGKLVPVLKGDLEMIVMKALRREPQERYATVEQLAEDLESYLDSRPIRARKGDAWYRTRKFLRRYWLPVGAVALAMAGLAAGLTIATHQRSIAQRRFMEVRQLANKLFDIDLEARKINGNTHVRQLIVDTSLEYLRRLSADAQNDPDLALEVGNAYMRVARVQGVPIAQNLGQMDQAAQTLKSAEKFLHAALEAQPGNRTTILRLAQTAHDRMLLARFYSKSDEALALARESAGYLEKFHATIADKPEAGFILVTYLNVADQHMLGRQFDDALRLCRIGTDLARTFNSRYYLGTFAWVSGEVYRRQGDVERALKDTRQAVDILQVSEHSPDRGPAMNLVLALIYEGRILGEENAINLGRKAEALATLQRAYKLADEFVHEDAGDQMSRGRIAMAGISTGDILRHSDPRRALEIYDHVLGHMAEIADNPSIRRFEVSALAGSSYALRDLGRPAEARQRLDAAFERLRLVKSYPAETVKPGGEPDLTLSALGDLQAATGNLPEAIATYEKLLAQVLAWQPKPESHLPDAVNVSRLYGALSALYRKAGKSDLAAAREEQRLAIWRHWDSKLPHNDFIQRQLTLAP